MNVEEACIQSKLFRRLDVPSKFCLLGQNNQTSFFINTLLVSNPEMSILIKDNASITLLVKPA